MGVSRMAGSPWHVEALRTGEDTRRHKSHCVYYDRATKHCRKIVDKCIGSAHCAYYLEYVDAVTMENALDIVDIEPTKDIAAKRKATELKAKTNSQSGKQSRDSAKAKKTVKEFRKAVSQNSDYPIGAKVVHIKFGEGVIKSYYKGFMTIVFQDGTEKHVHPKICFEDGTLKFSE